MSSQPFAIPAVLFFLGAIPLVLGLIPRNRFYGVRTAQTLSNESSWYWVNRLAAVLVMMASGVYGVVAKIYPYDRLASDNFSTWAVHLAGFGVPILIGLSVTGWYAKHRSG